MSSLHVCFLEHNVWPCQWLTFLFVRQIIPIRYHPLSAKFLRILELTKWNANTFHCEWVIAVFCVSSFTLQLLSWGPACFFVKWMFQGKMSDNNSKTDENNDVEKVEQMPRKITWDKAFNSLTEKHKYELTKRLRNSITFILSGCNAVNFSMLYCRIPPPPSPPFFFNRFVPKPKKKGSQ